MRRASTLARVSLAPICRAIRTLFPAKCRIPPFDGTRPMQSLYQINLPTTAAVRVLATQGTAFLRTLPGLTAVVATGRVDVLAAATAT